MSMRYKCVFKKKLVNFWQLIGLILFLALLGLSIGNCCLRCKDADKVEFPKDFLLKNVNKMNDDNKSEKTNVFSNDGKSDKSSDTKSDNTNNTKGDNSNDSREEEDNNDDDEDDGGDDKGNKKEGKKNNNKKKIYLVNEPLEQLEMVLERYEYKPKEKEKDKNNPEIFNLRKFPKKAEDGQSSGGKDDGKSSGGKDDGKSSGGKDDGKSSGGKDDGKHQEEKMMENHQEEKMMENHLVEKLEKLINILLKMKKMKEKKLQINLKNLILNLCC